MKKWRSVIFLILGVMIVVAAIVTFVSSRELELPSVSVRVSENGGVTVKAGMGSMSANGTAVTIEPSPVSSTEIETTEYEDLHSVAEIKEEIQHLEQQLEEEDVTAKLNGNEATPQQRQEWGEIFQKIVKLKERALTAELASISARLEELERMRAEQ